MGVTGHPLKAEVLQLAEEIMDLCHEHTSNETIATAAVEIPGKVITSQQFVEARVLSPAAP